MDAMEAMFTRRSIRKFLDQSVPEEKVEDILRAAMAAPSAGNEQPWHFIVIKDKKILAKISEVNPHAAMAPEAALAIVVCGDLGLEKHQNLWVQDCSAATQNILLAAHALGLGAVWTAVYPRENRMEKASELFNLPKQVIPFSIIPIGYPGERKESQNRYLESRIHQNKF